MRNVIRQAMGVVAGIAICILIIMVLEMAGHSFLTGDWLFLAPLAAYLLAAAGGGWVAIRVAGRRRWWLPALVVAFLAAGTIMNLTMMAHPVWFGPAAAISLALGFLICWRLTASRPAAA